MQLRIHTTKVLKIAYLEASESPRRAFYLLWIEKTGRGFKVCKESGVGAGCATLHRKAWNCETIVEAEKFFGKLVQRKTNENRKSPRKYRQIQDGATICALSLAYSPNS